MKQSPNPTRRWLFSPAVLAIGLSLPLAVHAQAPQQHPEVIVTAPQGRETDSVLPTAVPTGSAYGFDQSILNTPRSGSVLSKTDLQDNHVEKLSDLINAASNTFGPDVFGITSLPYIRGQEGELYINGMLRVAGNNAYGLPVSLNSVEAMDIVKGPASPVYGSTQRVGGFVNLVTKRAPLDRTAGEIDYSFGSYRENHYSLDIGTPLIKNELGLRLSFEGMNDGSYYRNAKFLSQDVYIALDWKPSDTFKYELSAELFNVPHYTDNAGINRPTRFTSQAAVFHP